LLRTADSDLRLAPLVAVLGATGTGKSALALRLAETFDGEIINCDSIQAYRGLDIGSAKLAPDARRGIPHHLIDAVSVEQELTAGEYSRLGRRVLAEVSSRNRLPIVAGGTGFYLRALLDGLSPAPARNEALRARLNEVAARRPAALHRLLRLRDPAAALRIHQNDRQKLIRALELMFLAGRPATAVQAAPRNRLEGFAVLKLGLAPDRALLRERLDRRSAAMFHSGLLEETRRLLACGAPAEAKPLQSLGYKQAQQVLSGELGLELAIRECQVKTKQYAKRQMTWFRHEPGMEWLHGFGDDPEIQRQATERVRMFLAGTR
jgi:tRNA dimethylallyltransferase